MLRWHVVSAEKFNEVEEVYSEGVWDRMELLAFARKVHRDYSLLAGEEPEGPAVIAALEAILQESQRWAARPPISLQPSPELSPAVVEGVRSWAQDMQHLLGIVSDLGNYCFYRLRKLRRLDTLPPGQAGGLPHSRELKVKNILLNNLEILLGRTRLASYPIKMELDPTNDCNLSCRACRHGLYKSFYHVELQREHIQRLGEALPFVEYLYMFGTGEPMLATRLAELIDVAKQYGCTVDLLTNGTRLSQTELPWDCISRLGISIDGAEEETMRLLRPFARLSTILARIAAVRAKAPHLTLYAKVTVSRMNLDELPAIVEILGQAGVNEVIFHSLRSFSPVHERFQVRRSDRPLLLQQVEAARRAARHWGMTFVNALSFDEAAIDDTEGLDKQALSEWLRQLPVPAQPAPKINEIAAALGKTRFSFYPIAWGGPPVENRGQATASPEVQGDAVACPRFSTAAAPACTPETIDSLIRGLAKQAGELRDDQVRIPYCFMPWKMPTVDPDARVRVCCATFHYMGDLDSRGFSEVWNSPGYMWLRAAMFNPRQLPKVCRLCTSEDRSAFSGDTLVAADLLGIPIRQSPGYPAPVNIGELLRSAENPAWREIEIMGAARGDAQHGFVLPAGAQVIVRFSNPRARANVYYQGKFRITGSRLLLGIKPLGGADMWNYMLDPRYIQLLGDWVGLPMPPLPLDFSSVEQDECCLFLWAPSDNRCAVELAVREFAGVTVVPGGGGGDELQARHLWSS